VAVFFKSGSNLFDYGGFIFLSHNSVSF